MGLFSNDAKCPVCKRRARTNEVNNETLYICTSAKCLFVGYDRMYGPVPSRLLHDHSAKLSTR